MIKGICEDVKLNRSTLINTTCCARISSVDTKLNFNVNTKD